MAVPPAESMPDIRLFAPTVASITKKSPPPPPSRTPCLCAALPEAALPARVLVSGIEREECVDERDQRQRRRPQGREAVEPQHRQIGDAHQGPCHAAEHLGYA